MKARADSLLLEDDSALVSPISQKEDTRSMRNIVLVITSKLNLSFSQGMHLRCTTTLDTLMH